MLSQTQLLQGYPLSVNLTPPLSGIKQPHLCGLFLSSVLCATDLGTVLYHTVSITVSPRVGRGGSADLKKLFGGGFCFNIH